MKKILIISAVVLTILLGLTGFNPIALADPSPGEIWATDSTGTKKEVFDPSDTVYVKGVGLKKDVYYNVSIVVDIGTQIGPGDPIPINAIIWQDDIKTDPLDGSFGPTPIWSPSPILTPGYYDVFADCLEDGFGTRGIYDPGIDAKDEESPIITTAGFFVISEIPLGTIAVLFTGFIAVLIKRKRIFSSAQRPTQI